jgi:hypothetical protein
LKIFKIRNFVSCGHLVKHLAGTFSTSKQRQVDNLSNLSWGWPLALGTLHSSHLPSPSLPCTFPHHDLAGRPRQWTQPPPSGFPLYQSISAYPNAPAGFIDHPPLETTPNTLPFPSSSPKPTRTASPRSPSMPTTPVYKKPPLLDGKIHTTLLSLLDIIS